MMPMKCHTQFEHIIMAKLQLNHNMNPTLKCYCRITSLFVDVLFNAIYWCPVPTLSRRKIAYRIFETERDHS